MDRISVEGRKFVDNFGRTRIFNGVNYCDKGEYNGWGVARTFHLNGDKDSENLVRELSENGFNIIRLGVTWAAIEPEPNRYDEEYINRIEDFANLCEKYGIYFYLDLHQDLYGGPSDAGDGAPLWACMPDGAKFKPVKFVWAEGYFFRKAVHRCFDNFWANKEYDGIGIQTRFLNMWTHLAERFKDHPALFGFDLFNEPFLGSSGGKVFRKLILNLVKTVLTDKRCKKLWMIKQLVTGNAIRVLEPFNDPSLFRKVTSAGDKLVKKFDEEVYSDFISTAAKTVRDVTDNGIIIMENSYYSNLGIPYCAKAVNYNGVREKNLCYTPHAYDLMVDTPAYKYASDSRVWSIFSEQKKSADRLNVPLMVGEWGGHSDGTEWLSHINFLLDKFDENQWSHTYWSFYNGMFTSPISQSLVRSVPVAVCGTIEKYYSDRENNAFVLEFNQEKDFDVPTVIYAHKEIENIETDGEYIILPIADTPHSRIEIKTSIGKHKVIVSFK